MSGWGGGYVTDVDYVPGWYRQQSPAVLSLACLLGNVTTPMPLRDDPVSYLELGCGQGYGALLLAASNPGWRVTAVDFNPGHIATAREWAARIGLANITFLEDDLGTLAEAEASRRIPEADLVSLHGVWSWVSKTVQRGIVRLLAQKVRPGGVVHVSYNALPGWGPALGLQRLVIKAGRRAAARSDRQAEEGIKLARELYEAKAQHLTGSNITRALLEQFESMSVAYLAHEYINEDWAPCFMADVAEALSGAKLEYVASAYLPDNFSQLTLTPEQTAVANRQDDPLLRELVRDICTNRNFRNDVYVRGARRISVGARDAALMDAHLALAILPDDLPTEAEMPAGQAELSQGFYRPIVRAMRDGPRRVGDLLQLPEVEGRRDNPAELIGVLAGLGFAEPAIRPAAEPGAEAVRFNRLVIEKMVSSDSLARTVGAASFRLGGGMSIPLGDLMVVDSLIQGSKDIEPLMQAYGGRAPDPDKLREVLERSLRERVPLLRAAGLLS